MPLRSDPTLWFNLPGVVAAWQPVGAPNSLLARYNMAHGGDNRYRAAIVGAGPTWNPITGWYFAGNTTDYLNTGLTFAGPWSTVFRITGATANNGYLYGSSASAYRHSIRIASTELYYYYADKSVYKGLATSYLTSTLAITNTGGYKNGVLDGAFTSPAWSGSFTLFLGRSGGEAGFPTNMPAFAVYARTLTPAEVRSASHQITYANVNPEWSVWGVRRKWFLMSPTADPNATVLAVAGTATAAGITPTIYSSSDATVTAVVGTATAAGITPTLVTSPTIYANPGRAWAYGETDSTAGISSTAEVDQVGSAAGAGVAPGFSQIAFPPAATSIANGVEPTYLITSYLVGTTGTATAAGIAPTISIISLIVAVTGTAVAAGITPVVATFIPAPGRPVGSDAPIYGISGSDADIYSVVGSDTDNP